MKIIKKKQGQKSRAIQDLEPYRLFEWCGKVHIKLRDRNKNITDVWNMEDNLPEWLPSSATVKPIEAVYGPETEEAKRFKDIPYGDMFYIGDRQAGIYLKSYPVQGQMDEHSDWNACLMKEGGGEFVCVDGRIQVVHVQSSCTVVME